MAKGGIGMEERTPGVAREVGDGRGRSGEGGSAEWDKPGARREWGK